MSYEQAIAYAGHLAAEWFRNTGHVADVWRVSELIQAGGAVSHHMALKVARIVTTNSYTISRADRVRSARGE